MLYVYTVYVHAAGAGYPTTLTQYTAGAGYCLQPNYCSQSSHVAHQPSRTLAACEAVPTTSHASCPSTAATPTLTPPRSFKGRVARRLLSSRRTRRRARRLLTHVGARRTRSPGECRAARALKKPRPRASGPSPSAGSSRRSRGSLRQPHRSQAHAWRSGQPCRAGTRRMRAHQDASSVECERGFQALGPHCSKDGRMLSNATDHAALLGAFRRSKRLHIWLGVSLEHRS